MALLGPASVRAGDLRGCNSCITSPAQGCCAKLQCVIRGGFGAELPVSAASAFMAGGFPPPLWQKAKTNGNHLCSFSGLIHPGDEKCPPSARNCLGGGLFPLELSAVPPLPPRPPARRLAPVFFTTALATRSKSKRPSFFLPPTPHGLMGDTCDHALPAVPGTETKLHRP